MKPIVLALFFVVAVSARPRFLVIPMEDVEFVGEPHNIPVYPMMPTYNNRVRRDIDDDDVRDFPPQPNRRQGLGGPPLVDVPNGSPGSFIGAINAAGIPSAGDSLASGSNAYRTPPQGSDYVDYGAYTGKKGAFGWYSDHPVLLKGHH